MPETDAATLLADAAARAARYLSEIQDRPVAPTPDALAGLARLAPPLPERGLAAERVLASSTRRALPRRSPRPARASSAS